MKKSCPKCRNPMILLLTSFVCDVCEPPGGVLTKPSASNFDPSQHMRLWVYGDRSCFSGGVIAYPRKTKENAREVREAELGVGDGNCTFFKVWMNFKADDDDRYHTMLGAKSYNDRNLALENNDMWNACWPVEE